MKNYIFSAILFVLFATTTMAQEFDLSAEIRPRFENNHGQGTLMTTDGDGSSFVSQRSRLNFKYKNDKVKLGIIFQNIRVWGDVSTLATDDKAAALHEAWAEVILSKKFSIKAGRQEIIYDDHRIFGSVAWAQQARSHDALIAKFKVSEKSKLDVGFAMNADNQGRVGTLYSNVAGYKAFQYAWFHTQSTAFGASFLFLNNGIQFLDTSGDRKVDYSQTIGTRLTYKKGKLAADVSAYVQTGKVKANDVSASDFAVNLKYKAAPTFTLGLGMEYLSGKDMDDTSSDVKSFTPFYGTNHKFNGWMDYFYVGNHGGSVGLLDLNATLAYKKDKFSLKAIPHIFSSAADIYNTSGTKMESNLGTEFDFVLGYKISKEVNLNIGHSMLFATESMEVLKGGDKDETNSWSWVMLTVTPKLFSFKKEAKKVD
jgi:hypothetical protein